MPSTFRAYGVDADGDGRADICGLADSLHSAARYLNVLGADADPASPSSRRALKRYGTAVERVLALAGG
jgi:membrane-bound lytic murein transglycosylase B